MSHTADIGIIGGSGFYQFKGEGEPDQNPFRDIETPFDKTPVRLYSEQPGGRGIWFLPRHGIKHETPPHKINYRANIWALREAGAEKIIAVNAVGGISTSLTPGQMLLPDQLIDYTWGRQHTYFDGLSSLNDHVDFTRPYDESIRQALLSCAHDKQIPLHDGGCLACTQGPRLETAAEIQKFSNDGCHIVGMTGMPEAALAREAGLGYACIALVVNPAAGIGEEEITIESMKAVLEKGLDQVRELIRQCLPLL